MSELIIEAGKQQKQYWRDLWRYRELFYFLAWRDILVRYKQTVIGIAWAVLRPLLTMVIMVVVFQKVAGMEANPPGTPYAILVFAGLLPWQFFSTALAESSNSLVVNANLVAKIYFPRMIVPASSVITSLVDFFIAGCLLGLCMLYYDFGLSWRILTLPLFTIIAFLAALGPGLWMTALNVKYRDVRYVVPFIVQMGLYISPVGFDSSKIPEKWQMLYSANPMVGVIDGFRWAIIGGEYSLNVPGFIFSIFVVIALLFSGVWYFRRTERGFADVI